jgi:dipeptidyl aminopeptidase/acylaminoacyl peptidase
MKFAPWRLLAAASLMSIVGPALAAPPAPPPLDAYGDLPAIEDMAISPSGAGIAFVARIKGERRLVVIDADHKPRVNAPVGDAKLRGLEWAGEDMVLVFTSATQNLGYGFNQPKHEFFGALMVPLDGDKIDMVFNKTDSLAHAIFGDYGIRHIDGKWLGYFGGIRFRPTADRTDYEFDNGQIHLFAVDLTKNSPREAGRAAPEGHSNDWLIDGNGQVAATLDIRDSDGKWEITNGQGTALASGTDPSGRVGLVALDRTGAGVVYSREDAANQKILRYDVPLAGGPPREILADVNVDKIYVSPDSGRLLGYLDGDSGKPVMFDPAQQLVLGKVYKAFPNLDVEIEQWTPDFKHVLVHVSGNGDSGAWYAVDMSRMRADPIGYDRPRIDPDEVGRVSTISYKAADGLQLDGILTLPPGREPRNLPVVMFPHGGPHAYDKETFDWWAQAFASRGYAVFQPNFRGSTNRDDAFVHAGDGQWGRKMQTDISDGLAELARRGIVDPKRACIMGASYGGYAALAGVTLQHGIYRCAVADAPVTDVKDMYWTDYRESGSDKMLERNYKESLGDPRTYDEISPRKHAAQADAPILLIHGKDDTVVNFHQSAAMADALKDAGKPYELVVMDKEDHWLSHAETRKQMLEAAMKFVQKYNPAD